MENPNIFLFLLKTLSTSNVKFGDVHRHLGSFICHLINLIWCLLGFSTAYQRHALEYILPWWISGTTTLVPIMGPLFSNHSEIWQPTWQTLYNVIKSGFLASRLTRSYEKTFYHFVNKSTESRCINKMCTKNLSTIKFQWKDVLLPW